MCSCGSQRKETEMKLESNSPSGDTPCSASSEPLHVYDWLDQPAKDENERQAKEWLNKFVLPPGTKYKSGASDWLTAHALTCEWRGQRYWCRGASRMGDVWITKDPTYAKYYDHRVDVEELSNWKRFNDARGNLQNV